jgi:L-threonylcarbamoyladenylate synthase
MEHISLTDGNVAECATKAATVLRSGGVVVYPTDTLYGLGADALSDRAVAKLYVIKGRDERKPVHALVADSAMAARYGEISGQAKTLSEQFGGKVTLIVKKRTAFDSGIVRAVPTFGFRIPDNEYCLALLRELGGPITATSANESGAASPRRIASILAQLGEKAQRIDLVIDAGELPESKPSTVVDLTCPEPIILREGAILAADIFAALHLG